MDNQENVLNKDSQENLKQELEPKTVLMSNDFDNPNQNTNTKQTNKVNNHISDDFMLLSDNNNNNNNYNNNNNNNMNNMNSNNIEQIDNTNNINTANQEPYKHVHAKGSKKDLGKVDPISPRNNNIGISSINDGNQVNQSNEVDNRKIGITNEENNDNIHDKHADKHTDKPVAMPPKNMNPPNMNINKPINQPKPMNPPNMKSPDKINNNSHINKSSLNSNIQATTIIDKKPEVEMNQMNQIHQSNSANNINNSFNSMPVLNPYSTSNRPTVVTADNSEKLEMLKKINILHKNKNMSISNNPNMSNFGQNMNQGGNQGDRGNIFILY